MVLRHSSEQGALFIFHKHPVGRIVQGNARRDIDSRGDIERDEVQGGCRMVRGRFDQGPYFPLARGEHP